jgi:very-short-patch-repair endonuclease
LARGVYLTYPDDPSRADWAQVGMVLGGSEAALSGWDAVRAHGLGTSWPAHEHVLVLTPPGHRNRRVGGLHLRPSGRPVQARQLSETDDLLPGVRVVTTPRAVADTALAYQQLAPVRAMVTAGIQRQLCTTGELVRELAAGPMQGSVHFRRALADLLDDVHSVAEAEAVELLRKAGVDGFIANAPIPGEIGRLYRVDLLWPQLRAVIEIDSREFHFSESEWKQTMARHNELTDLGFAVKHYPPSVIRSGGLAWAYEVSEWLKVRAAQIRSAPGPRA